MPQISDIEKFASSLKPHYVHYDQLLCVRSRNRYATCSACMDACCVNALSFMGKSMVIDFNACMNCGACCVACPSQALASLNPTDTELAAIAVETALRNDGLVCFACARAASKRIADETKIIPVDCLSRIDEALLAGLVAHGATRVVLVDGTCGTCKYRSCGAFAHETADQMNQLLSCYADTIFVECASEFPAGVRTEFDDDALGRERRNLFTRSSSTAADVAKTVATTTLKEQIGLDLGRKTTLSPMRHPEVHRIDDLLDSLDRMGEFFEGATFETRRFGEIALDNSTCNGCMKCFYACPTQALTKSLLPTEEGGAQLVEFTPSRCNRCGVCVDVCEENSISLLPEVRLDHLFEFEPQVFETATRPAWMNAGQSWLGGSTNSPA